MGEVELLADQKLLLVHSHIITYGTGADPAITSRICEEIETMWNEPGGVVAFHDEIFPVRFRISGQYHPHIEALEINQNLDPRNNYFRIEAYSFGNISFVDGLGSNTGYFQLDNLYPGSTTAAHEYGHTLGLDHPRVLDIRGHGVPGIMYPRGTLVDAPYQYNPEAKSGDSNNGGTMHPMHRRVRMQDIDSLHLSHLKFFHNKATAGAFSSVWHPNHRDVSPPDY